MSTMGLQLPQNFTPTRIAAWLWVLVAGFQTILTGSSILSRGGPQNGTDWLTLAIAVFLVAVALLVARGLAREPTRSIGYSSLALALLWAVLGVESLILGTWVGVAMGLIAVAAGALSIPALRTPR